MNEGLAIFLSSLVTGATSVVSVLIATRRQTGQIDRNHRAALEEQTARLAPQLKGDPNR